jgi:hypothetical protein
LASFRRRHKDSLFAFSLPLALSQPHSKTAAVLVNNSTLLLALSGFPEPRTGATAVFVDEFDAGCFQCASNGHVICCS